jgi:hypothetical protein
MNRFHSSLFVLAGLAGSCVRGPAEIMTFSLNPAQSTITITGSTLGTDFEDQGSGSRTTSFTGSLKADVTATTIQFLAGSSIDARTNGAWSPLPGGASGTAAADFGARVQNPLATATAALRNIVLDASGPVLPLSAGSFNSSSLVFEFPTNGTAALDYRATGALNASNSEKLESRATNNVTTSATLVEQAGTQTLTIPVKATFLFDLFNTGDTTVTLTGSLVGVRTAPPSIVFNAGSLSLNGSAVGLQWQAPAGQTFRIESSSNLVNWSTRASNITSASMTYSWSGTVSGPTEYYRLAQ